MICEKCRFFCTLSIRHSSLYWYLSQELLLENCSDEKLVAGARRGEKSAYAVLVKRHYRGVFAVCLGVLGNVHDAEDSINISTDEAIFFLLNAGKTIKVQINVNEIPMASSIPMLAMPW